MQGPFANRDKSGRRDKRIQNRHANTALLVLRKHVYPLLLPRMCTCRRIFMRFPAFGYDCINHSTVTFLPRGATRMHKASRHACVFMFVDFGTHMFLPGTMPYTNFTFESCILERNAGIYANVFFHVMVKELFSKREREKERAK